MTVRPTPSARSRHKSVRLAAVPLAALAGFALLAAGCKSTGSSSARNTQPSAAQSSVGSTGVRGINPTLAVATFNAAWQLVNESHFDPNFNGVDWQAVHDELSPRIATVTNEDELRGIIQDMLSRLGQSHFALLPREAVDRLEDDELSTPKAERNAPAKHEHAHDEAPHHAHHDSDADDASHDSHDDDEADDATDSSSDEPSPEDLGEKGEGDLGINVALIDDQIIVSNVASDSPAGKAGVRSGWVLEEVDGRNVAQRIKAITASVENDKMASYHAMQVVKHRLDGTPNTTVELTLLDENNKPVTLELTRRKKPGELIKFGNLPPMNAHLEHERLVDDHGAQIGLIRFSIWMLPLNRPFALAVDDLRDTDGMVIDLRGNPGGVGGMAMGIAGYFLDDETSLGMMKMRSGELHFNVAPRRFTVSGEYVRPFGGPMAILVDRYTASTSEIFAAGMQSIGRARIFGETSAGAALPAQMTRLPNGDVLLHAFADFILPTGESVEGTGVVPDAPIELSRQDLLGGRDPVLDAAVAWIAAQSPQTSAAALIAK